MKRALPVLALAALPVSGCINERVYVDPHVTTDFEGGAFSETKDLNVFAGTLRGDFGPRRGFDGQATSIQALSDAAFNSSSVAVERLEPGRGLGMVIVYTSGVLLEDLPLGTNTFRYDPAGASVPPVGASVCSGSEDGTIDYDLPADKVTVEVAVTPEGRTYDIQTETAVLDTTTGESTGAVELSHSTFTLGSSR